MPRAVFRGCCATLTVAEKNEESAKLEMDFSPGDTLSGLKRLLSSSDLGGAFRRDTIPVLMFITVLAGVKDNASGLVEQAPTMKLDSV